MPSILTIVTQISIFEFESLWSSSCRIHLISIIIQMSLFPCWRPSSMLHTNHSCFWHEFLKLAAWFFHYTHLLLGINIKRWSFRMQKSQISWFVYVLATMGQKVSRISSTKTCIGLKQTHSLLFLRHFFHFYF